MCVCIQTEVHYALILMLLTYYCLVCFFCSHTALASLFSLFVFWNLSAGCLLQMSQIKLSSLSMLWNVPSSDAGCFLHSSTLGSGRPETLLFGLCFCTLEHRPFGQHLIWSYQSQIPAIVQLYYVYSGQIG